MRGTLTTILALTAVMSVVGSANADFIVYGTHTDHDLAIGAALDDIRLLVELEVDDGIATMTFENDSNGFESSAIFKEIVLDTYDNDTGTAILWNPVIVESPGSFKVKDSNGLPGYNPVTKESPKLLEFYGKTSGKNGCRGLEIGDTLAVQFRTSLADGSDINDYFNAFSDGCDTAAYSIGFHAISADIVNGQSLSGIVTNSQVPEPATMALLAGGGITLLLRRKRRIA